MHYVAYYYLFQLRGTTRTALHRSDRASLDGFCRRNAALAYGAHGLTRVVLVLTLVEPGTSLV